MNSQVFESYVPVYDVCPENWEEARQFLVEQLKKISNAVNIREIGWFLDEELLSGKQFIPSATAGVTQGTAPQYRTVLRKVVDTGQLPAVPGVPKLIPHGITVTESFNLVQIYGAASQPPSAGGPVYIPMPFVEVLSPTGSIQLYMDGTNLIIASDADVSKFTISYVVIEYIDEL